MRKILKLITMILAFFGIVATTGCEDILGGLGNLGGTKTEVETNGETTDAVTDPVTDVVTDEKTENESTTPVSIKDGYDCITIAEAIEIAMAAGTDGTAAEQQHREQGVYSCLHAVSIPQITGRS